MRRQHPRGAILLRLTIADHKRGVRVLVAAAIGLSLAAALIHAAVAPEHFDEYTLFGVFFVSAALFQLAWAERMRRSPSNRLILIVGVAANLAIVTIWVVSRTAGVPLGPEAGVPEAIGAPDTICSIDELAIAGIAGLLLARRTAAPAGAVLVGGCSAGLAVASLIAVATGVGF